MLLAPLLMTHIHYIFVRVTFLTFWKLYFSRACQSPCILTSLGIWGNKTSGSTIAHIHTTPSSVSQAKAVLGRPQISKAKAPDPTFHGAAWGYLASSTVHTQLTHLHRWGLLPEGGCLPSVLLPSHLELLGGSGCGGQGFRDWGLLRLRLPLCFLLLKVTLEMRDISWIILKARRTLPLLRTPCYRTKGVRLWLTVGSSCTLSSPRLFSLGTRPTVCWGGYSSCSLALTGPEKFKKSQS